MSFSKSGGVTISEDFTAEVKEGVRVDATVLEHQAQVGDTVTVVVLREGRRLELPVVMKVPSPLVPTGEYDRDLPYRIFAGLVFQPLTQRYLSEYQEPPSHLNAFLMNPERGGYSMLVPSQGVKDRREVVVITNVLGSELSRGYEDFEDEVVYAMNGTPIRDLRHLSELLDTSNEEFVTITTEMGHVILIEPGRAKLASGELLEVYKIAADRSPELQPPANPTN